MRTLRPRVASLAAAVIATALLPATALHAQQIEPYPMTLTFGTGLINIPTAWVSPRSSDVWLNSSALDLPSQNGMNFGERVNTNLALDTHWAGRVSVGGSLYSQNPEWGLFGQVLLLPQSYTSWLPAISVGARNIGPFNHEDRFLIGHDVHLVNGTWQGFTPTQYDNFQTSPTLYAVASKDFLLSSRSGTDLGISLGGGNGLFSQDGGLGKAYDKSGTIVRGMFLGARLVTHPSFNTTFTLMGENDGWDYNAGVLADWRGITLGVYGLELDKGFSRNTLGLGDYNYAKLDLALGYSGNLVDISHGFILRGHITELAREQQMLRYEIAARNRRINGLEVALAKAQTGELATIAQRRQALERDIAAEQAQIQQAQDRLRQLEQQEQQQQRPPQKPPTTPPTF